MKKLIASLAVFTILLALLLAGCSLDAPSDPTGSVNDPGPANASTPYVAIGNSLTAGFMDSGLMKAGQANSYPMIVASQMGLDQDSFTQPWMEAPGIGTTSLTSGEVAGVLFYSEPADPLPTPTVAVLDSTPVSEIENVLLAVKQPTQFHNLGVPFAFAKDLMNAHNAITGYAYTDWPAPLQRSNNFFEFINRAGGVQIDLFGNTTVPPNPPEPGYETGSQFYQTIAKGPALVTAWIGGNDFLFGATSGEPQGPAGALITPAGDINNPQPGTYAAFYQGFLHSLAGGLVKRNGFAPTIITATLPSVRNIPFFLDRPTFEGVFGGGYTYDEPDAAFILFTDFLASGLVTNPTGTLSEELTLDAGEVDYLDNQVIGAYNTTIMTVTAQVNGNPAVPANAAFVDTDAAMDELRNTDPDALRHFILLRFMSGFAETIEETAAKPIFSLDGVHPNNKGYAFVANMFLAKINEVTGSEWVQVPIDAFSWDPTYGTGGKSGLSGISPEVAEALKCRF